MNYQPLLSEELLNELFSSFEKKLYETEVVTQRFINIDNGAKLETIVFISFISWHSKNQEYNIYLTSPEAQDIFHNASKKYYAANYEYLALNIFFNRVYDVIEITNEGYRRNIPCVLALEYGYEIDRFIFYFIPADYTDHLSKFSEYPFRSSDGTFEFRELGTRTKGACK